MNPNKDLVIGAIACAVIYIFFLSIELVDTVSDYAQDHQDWRLGEILAAVPALAIVTAWFAVRRWLEAARLSDRLEATIVQLKEAIDQRRAMEEQIGEAYKMAAMGQLAGGLTRELNNVMQPIVTLSQLSVDRDAPADEMRDRMHRILEAAERGTAILESSLAHPVGGASESHEIDPSQAVSDLIAQARDALGQGVEIHANLDEGPGVIRASRDEFDAVLTTLLNNAAEAMERRGKITVRVETCTVDAGASAEGVRPGNYFRLTVTDTGPGMSTEVKDRAFDPFFTTKGAQGAAGLGLAAAYNQVHGWDGRISLKSAPGQGTTAEVLVPRHVEGR